MTTTTTAMTTNPGITLGPINPGGRVEPHPALANMNLQPEAVVFNFVHPARGLAMLVGLGILLQWN